MYNRYIPQPDGSFRRNRMDEPRRQPAPPPPRPKEPPRQQPPCCPPPEPAPCPPPPKPEPPCREPKCDKGGSIPGFLQNLLPKDLDTGDLIVILLLLLLAGDCEENRTNALLTLVLYLFM